MRDDLRARGTVEVECSRCGWSFWLDPLDPQLNRPDTPDADAPILCASCSGHDTGEKAEEPHGQAPAFNPGRN